jgi:hypothetical protein
MFGIFPNFSKYFNAKIYPASYGNRNRSKTEIVGDTSNNIYDTTQTYKHQLQTIFQDRQESKRKKKPGSSRIRGESF